MTQGGLALLHWLALRPVGAAHIEQVEPEEAEPEHVWTAEALHQRYLADVYASVARRVPNRQEAEDITAEVFVAAFTALPRQKPLHHPYPWLLGIARRKITDYHRRQSRKEGRTSALADDFPSPASDLPEAIFERDERLRLVRAMLTRLPANQREALLLHYVEGLSQAEVALVLGRSPAAINSLLQRVRAAVYKQGQDYSLGESEAKK